MSDDGYYNYHYADSNSVENNEHYIFVQLLAKYKVLLGREKSPNIHEKKCAAATALCKEYNEKCERKLTRTKVLKKVCNMKARLKEKNYKNLSRAKKLEYTDWEQMFLDLWVGSGITVLANKVDKSFDVKCQPEIITSNDLPVNFNKFPESNESSTVRSRFENYTTDGVTVKMEPDDNFLQDNSQISTVTSSLLWAGESEHETRFEDEKDDDEKYKRMTLDELKHVALRAQIKMLNEQTAAAKAKKELKLYKLSLLKLKNES